MKVTETHPKAVLEALGCEAWNDYFKALPTGVNLKGQPDHRRDAVISAVAAREGFESRWKKGLIEDRYLGEQNPADHWLAPIHYFWPG